MWRRNELFSLCLSLEAVCCDNEAPEVIQKLSLTVKNIVRTTRKKEIKDK